MPSYVQHSVLELPERETDRILYVLTVEDLKGIYEDVKGYEWVDLSDEDKALLIGTAEKYIEGLVSDGLYGWSDALIDAVDDWHGDKQGKI